MLRPFLLFVKEACFIFFILFVELLNSLICFRIELPRYLKFMLGIYQASLITTFLAVLIFGYFILKKADRADCLGLFISFLLGIPAFWCAFYWFRVPLDNVVRFFVSDYQSNSYGFLTFFYAPFAEELMKLIVVLLPFIYSKIKKSNFYLYAFAVGLGFGVGEIWFLANGIAQDPGIANFPWYYFGGFLNERVLVTFIHGGLLMISLSYLLTKQFRGILYAMFAHWVLNIPIFLGVVFDLNEYFYWVVFLSVWVLMFSALILFLMSKFIFEDKKRVGYLLSGKAKCPGCESEYDRPVFGVAMLIRRYEKCPHCEKWHWTKSMNIKKDR